MFEFHLEEDEVSLNSDSFRNDDSVLRAQEMESAYGGWVGSQVKVTALGSLSHFK